ncbi:MAG TPA: ABC transporter permease [Bryobacteraceae bacterium]|nr:ABC transporter permease [Bryobacteraceae bacterium]
MLADLRFALRTFAKAPGFVVVAVLITALGIGANTAIFSVVRAVILRALPLRDPDQLVMVWEKNPQLTDFLGERSPVALQNYLEWKKSAQSFSAMSAFTPDHATLTGLDKPEEIQIAVAAYDLPDLFGVRPMLGRMFVPDEEHTAVISHALFTRTLGGDARRLGGTIELNGRKYTIVGVWPPEFHFPAMWQGFDETKADVWLQLNVRANQPVERLRSREKFVYGRLRTGVTLAQARAEMEVINARIRRENPELNAGFGINVFSVSQEDVSPSTRRYVLILQGAVGLVLLIACANVANLLLARSIARRKEIAVRIALGASRWRLARQALSESLLLSFMGGAAGLALARWAIAGMTAMAPHDTPHLHDFKLDAAGLAFTALVTVLTGLIFGLAPSLDAARRNINDALNQGGRSGSTGISKRLRSVLVIGEVALALVLLVGAGLLIRTVRAMFAADPGFRRDGLLTARLNLPPARYAKDEQLGTFNRELLAKASTVHGVISATIAEGVPTQNLNIRSYSVDGTSKQAGVPESMTAVRYVAETYFQTMIIPLLRGRAFTREDVENPKSNVIVINQAFARQVWPGADPIGKAIQESGERRVVVGVVADAAQLGPDMPIDPEIYLPAERYRQVTLVVRTIRDRKDISAELSGLVWSIDKDLPVRIQTLNESLGEFIEEKKFVMNLLGSFAGLALLLAAAGIYGVLAYSVSQRTREIGIRMAVGANSADILKLIVREGLVLAFLGVAGGLAGAAALTRLMSGLLFGVSTTDPSTFLFGAIALIGTAAFASCVPARRAAKLAPLDALRDE